MLNEFLKCTNAINDSVHIAVCILRRVIIFNWITWEKQAIARRRRISQIVAHRKYFFIFFSCVSRIAHKKKLCPTIFISFIVFNKSLCHAAIPYGCCLSSFSTIVYFLAGSLHSFCRGSFLG